MLNCIDLNAICCVRLRYLIVIGKYIFISAVNCLLLFMVRELVYVPYLLVSIPGLIFVISVLLFLFVSANASTYISLPLVATLYIFHELPQ
jgi:hypothetical protein